MNDALARFLEDELPEEPTPSTDEESGKEPDFYDGLDEYEVRWAEINQKPLIS